MQDSLDLKLICIADHLKSYSIYKSIYLDQKVNPALPAYPPHPVKYN